MTPLVNTGLPLTTNHTWVPSGNQALLLFIMGCATIVGFLVADFGGAILDTLKLSVAEEVELVDE